MVDVAAVVKEFSGVRPVAGLDDCWTWSAGRFYFTIALTADDGHAMQLNCREVLDLNLVVAVLAFARRRTEAVLAGAPFAVMEGFTSTSATPFDCVAAAIPAIARYHEFDHPDLNDVTYAVFPAYRCEFSGRETQEEATYTFDRVLDAANPHRPPSPWVRMRFDNPKTGTGSVGPDLGIASADLLMQEMRNLEHADNAFVEFENFRHERRRVSWCGELQLLDEDKIRIFELPDLLAWTHRFIHEGSDSAAEDRR
ncbi:MAG TPA: hypothetical protein VFR73_16565 [Hyphomicrobiaceae bacterium]|nr:hypothetical protein [Hyphomicrobiaceae bacterium]